MSPSTASVSPVILPLSHTRSPEILAVGTQLHVSVSHVDVALDRGVHVHVAETGVHVAVDGTLDAHVAEIGVHVAEHLALDQDVAEPGMHVVLHLPVYLHVTDHGRDVLLRLPWRPTSPTSRCSAAYAGRGSRTTRPRTTTETVSNGRASILARGTE